MDSAFLSLVGNVLADNKALRSHLITVAKNRIAGQNNGNDEIRQRELVSFGGKVASEVRCGPPIVPAGLDVVRQLQSGRNPICLILAPKTQKDSPAPITAQPAEYADRADSLRPCRDD